MAYGKKITLFLMDGKQDGRISCELSNWMGKAYRIPRPLIRQCNDKTDLDNAGVYILFGKSDDPGKEGQAYIGEADGIRRRLEQHLTQKDFWNDAIVFISKDNNLNKAHIKYLESKLYETAVKADRYKLENTNKPTPSTISEPEMAEMEEFMSYIKLLIGTLGFKIFEPLVSPNETHQETLFIRTARGVDAQGIRTPEGFVVLKNSRIATETTNSCSKNYRAMRERLLADHTIVADSNGLRLTKDTLFSSASTAASIVMGRSANGLTEWKTKDGRILKSLETN
ncbi:MAG: GIY-YIG nuclease family protein [Alistipes sp.]|nr:GIY-YIG nuclease family protein [Alistipes sp.]